MATMAKGTLICIFSLLLFSSLSICIRGTVVDFYYDARRNAGTSSIIRPMSFSKLGKVHPSHMRILVYDPSALHGLSSTGLPADVYLDQAQHLKEPRNSQVYGASWLKIHIIKSLRSGMKINSIIISSSFTDWKSKHELHMLLSTLKSTTSLVTSIRQESSLKVSVALPLSLLQSSGAMQKKYLTRIFHVLEKGRSFITIEASIDGVVTLEDGLLQLIREKASLAASLLSRTDVPILLTIKSKSMPSPLNLAEFDGKILRSFENETRVMFKIHGFLLEVPSEVLRKKVRIDAYISNASHRELLDDLKPVTTSHDIFNPATSPSATSSDFPPYNPSPTIVIIPGTYPATYPPTNPATTPVMIPSATPTDPFSSPVPATNPGAQPITNPVTTYPSAPAGYVPIPSTPVTIVPTPVTGAPIVPGQTWCIARTGTLESALQTALDYACGIGGADCSMIQPGASCYNPNTVEIHASYAFNIYFQKNPVPSSCDFGGTAVLINANPSSGTCIYPLLVTAAPVTTLPPVTTIPSATATSVSGVAGSSGSRPSPSVLSATNPTSSSSTIYGSESPPALNSTASRSIRPHPFIDCMILIGMFTFGKISLF